MSLTDDQLEQRRSGITASEIGALFGRCPWRQAYDVYLEKTSPNTVRSPETDYQRWGHIMEPVIAKAYSERTGRVLRDPHKTFKSRLHRRIMATPDRLVRRERRGVEIKNVDGSKGHEWGHEGTDDVPDHYLLQAHQNMLVMNYPVWDVAALIGKSDLRIYEIRRNKEIDSLIIRKVVEFWVNHVNKLIPPPIDYEHRSTTELLKALHRSDVTPEHKLLTPVDANDLTAWHQTYESAKAKAREYEQVAQTAMNHLRAELLGAGVATCPDGSYFEVKRVETKATTIERDASVSTRVIRKGGN